MARKGLDPKKEASLFEKTESAQPQESPAKPKDEVKSYGVGLRESEWLQIEAIAAEMSITKHAVAAYALKDFLKRWDAGEIETQARPSFPDLD